MVWTLDVAAMDVVTLRLDRLDDRRHLPLYRQHQTPAAAGITVNRDSPRL